MKVREIKKEELAPMLKEMLVETMIAKPSEGESKKVAALRLLFIEASRHALTTEVRMGWFFV